MKDLFEREQQIFDAAFKRSDTIGAEYEALAIEQNIEAMKNNIEALESLDSGMEQELTELREYLNEWIERQRQNE